MKIIDINGNKRECVNAYPDKDYPGFIKIEFSTKLRSYTEWYPIEEFKIRNPDLEYLVKGVPKEAKDSAGVVSKSTETTFTDSQQKWEKNIYTGFPMWISRGKGEGQVRTILSNTSSTVVIDKPWETRPNKFSQYVISRNIREDVKPAGNILTEEEIHKFELKAKKMDRDREKAIKTANSITR